MKIRNLKRLKYERFILLLNNVDTLETELQSLGIDTSRVVIDLFIKGADIFITIGDKSGVNIFKEFGLYFKEDKLDIRYVGEDVSLDMEQLEEIESIIEKLRNIFDTYDKKELKTKEKSILIRSINE